MLKNGRKSKQANTHLTLLFSQPVIAVRNVEKGTGLSTKSANDLVRNFIQLGILKEITGYKGNRLFAFEQYLAILMKSGKESDL